MKIIRTFLVFICVIFLLILSGCATNVIYKTVVKDYPLLAVSYPSLTPIGSNDARVILYLPDQFVLTLFDASDRIYIEGENGSMSSDVGVKTAEIFDIPAGNYSLWIKKNEKIKIHAQPGNIYFYNILTLKNWINLILPPITNIEECFSDISMKDIRCAHKECLIKTITPKNVRVINQYSTNSNHKQLTLEARKFNIGMDVSRIYITRKVYTLGMVRVGLDSKPEIKVNRKSFVVYEVKPGVHIVAASIRAHGIEQAYKLTAKGGESYFFSSDTFNFLESGKGKELVNDYDLIEEGFFRE